MAEFDEQTCAFLHAYYDFVHNPRDRWQQEVGGAVRSELLRNLSLMPFWITDISRPSLPILLATDASSSFGLGFCLARCPPDVVRQVAAHAG